MTSAQAVAIEPVDQSRREQPEALHELQQRALAASLESVLPELEAELSEHTQEART